MGMIKLPKKSIDFFNNNYLDIFESGNLARICNLEYTKAI